MRVSTSGASYEISSQQYISFIKKESNMHKEKSPPVNLDTYLEGDKKRYLNYEDAARHYSMPYWTLVNLAKEAGATWVLRKTAMVDIDKLDAYLDKNYAVAGNKNKSV